LIPKPERFYPDVIWDLNPHCRFFLEKSEKYVKKP
jgi:hypothetical protein